MNRIAQFTIALSALFCAISCSEKISTDFPDASDYITVTSEVGPQVKAGYEGTSSLPNTFYMTIRQGSDEKGYNMSKGNGNNYNFLETAPTWASLDASQVYVKAITASINDIDNAGILTFSVQKDQSDGSGVKSSDLLAAKTGAGITISGNNINVAFNHLLTKLKVTYTKPENITVRSITLKNVCLSGRYNCIDMLHMPSENPSLGEITMFQENNSAEAIFFPYTPTGNPVLVIDLGDKTLECPFSLKKYDSFYGGKQYGVKIQITRDKAENVGVTIQGWNNNSGNTQLSGERILWVGTSIPGGDAATGLSYPKLVDEALDCEIINRAIAGSCLCMQPNANWAPNMGWSVDIAGALSQTEAEAEAIYRSAGSAAGFDEATINGWLEQVKERSYERLIIPYIDGREGYPQCSTVIIDHGYNDRNSMLFEVLPLHEQIMEDYADFGGPFRGYNWLMGIKAQKFTLDNNTVYPYIIGRMTEGESYILAMTKIINAIKATNPNVRIIIGNYFTSYNPYITAQFAASYFDAMYFSSLICCFNEAVAGLHGLDIVNPYKYIWLNDSDFPKITSDQYGVYVKTEDIDPTKFCPDGVHPTNPDAVQAIADVYIRELQRILGSKAN